MLIVPYVSLNPATAAALPDGWQGRYVGSDDAAYFRLLRDLWTVGDSFTVVEHDIVPTPDALTSLRTCSSVWCGCPYPYLYGELMAGLGCTRFDTALVRRHPDLFEVVAGMSDSTHPPMHWCRLDAWIYQTLTARGETRCEDHPQVGHEMRQRGSAHGCYVI